MIKKDFFYRSIQQITRFPDYLNIKTSGELAVLFLRVLCTYFLKRKVILPSERLRDFYFSSMYRFPSLQNMKVLKRTLVVDFNKRTLIRSSTLRKKVSLFGVILARIFPHSDSIRRDTKYISIFSSNAGKYGPE